VGDGEELGASLLEPFLLAPIHHIIPSRSLHDNDGRYDRRRPADSLGCWNVRARVIDHVKKCNIPGRPGLIVSVGPLIGECCTITTVPDSNVSLHPSNLRIGVSTPVCACTSHLRTRQRLRQAVSSGTLRVVALGVPAGVLPIYECR
jgi:hypothetical protein